ncbi:hypothetical protein MKW98_014580 [Papaver atlanticum]|uniref:Uncharacterized protein n=1 Tax=Papaver atlanticum TaxID=357466 RepID=A0AAD4XEF1_9MAGN|nr:hypothetical protein MKW98_014580 [Papaver atlanticum]
MEIRVLLVCLAVGFLGIVSAALGFAAEAKRIKVSEVQFSAPGMCTYPRSPALALGLTASVALVLAQVTINVSAGCVCCKTNAHPSNSNWTLALVCFVFSWFTFIIAFLLFLTGSALNDQHGGESMYLGSYCYVVKSGVFAGGAILSLLSVSLGILYYLTIYSTKNGAQWGFTGRTNQGGIAMAQPQVPPEVAHQPVFVPEDTYYRRQEA